MNREPAKHWFETDAVTGWRHVLCYMSRPGVAKRAKNSINRRVRRKNKDLIRKELEDE